MEEKLLPSLGIKSEIIFEKNFLARQHPDFNDLDAVWTCVAKHPKVATLVYKDYDYMINTREPVKVAQDIWFQLTDIQMAKDSSQIVKIIFKIYSEELPLEDLKGWVMKCRQDYEAFRNNKLGDDIFFFDQTMPNDQRFSTALAFDKKKFTTFRSFKNVFFEEKSVVEERVMHFKNNKQWYIDRGMPYTLGFVFSGPPGTGKTSTIKAIANETKRHIVNVRFSEIKTNTQLKNLFYNPVLQVVNPETLNVEKYTVPIHQRLYVIEDIDCMTDWVRKRDRPRHIDMEAKIKDLETKVAQKPKTQKVVVKVDDEELADYFQQALMEEKKDMEKEKEAEVSKDEITLDSLLNILDGTLEIPDRMFCMTTNMIDDLDPAIVRPGRADMIIKFKLANRTVIREMFESFYGGKFPPAFFDGLKDYVLSPAKVNQVMFQHFKDPEGALKEIASLQ